MTTTAALPAAGLTDADLAAIEGRLHVSGLFTAHAHTDVTRLLAEIRRFRAERAADRTDREGARR